MAIYVSEINLEIDQLKKIFVDRINKDHMYVTDRIEFYSIKAYNIIYPFIVGTVNNVEYVILNNGKEQTGKINTSNSYVDKNFILNELNKKDFVLSDKKIEDFNIYNSKAINNASKFFYKELNDKMLDGICKRHTFNLKNKGNKYDISIIKDFNDIKTDYYIENVYEIITHQGRKKYHSLYSPLKQDFYVLDHQKSDLFKEYLMYYKTPIAYVPKELKDLYYQYSFNIFREVKEELKYISRSDLYKKYKKGIIYNNYSFHDDYLNKLIFFFKKKKYLKEWNYKYENTKEKMMFYFLTLNYLKQSGYELSIYAKSGIIKYNYLRLLEKSANLGSDLAKKELYEYYIHPKNYNEEYAKKYMTK